jgi:uncharacterized membrane protein YphA (DoxX/SURF4 family)
MGYLLLRGASAALLLHVTAVHLEGSSVLAFLAGFAAFAILVGAGARWFAGFAAVVAVLTAMDIDASRYFAHLSLLLASLGVALIGPGGFSIDALRFGRRTIHVKGANTKV